MITKGMSLQEGLDEAVRLGCKVTRTRPKVASLVDQPGRWGGSLTLPNGRVIRFGNGNRLQVKLMTPLLRLQNERSKTLAPNGFDRSAITLKAVERPARPNITGSEIQGFAARMETISPEIAMEWLAITDKNGDHNRKLITSWVDTLAREIREGRWDSNNGETLKLAADGSIMDGQHRAWAIVYANESVKALVVRGVPKSSFATIDTGRPRSASTILGLAKIGDGNHVAAVARLLMHMKVANTLGSGIRPMARKLVLAPDEVLRFVQRNAAIPDAVRAANAANYRPCVFNETALGAAYFVFRQLAPTEATDFFEALRGKAALELDDPARRLREYHTNAKLSGKTTDAEMSLALAFKAWNAFRAGKKTQILVWRPADETFPMIWGGEKVVIS